MDIKQVIITEIADKESKKYLARSPFHNFRMEYEITAGGQMIMHSYCGNGLTLSDIRSIARCNAQTSPRQLAPPISFSESFFDNWNEQKKRAVTDPPIPPELKKELAIYYTFDCFDLQGELLLSLRSLNGAYAEKFRLPFAGIPYLLYTASGQLYGVCQFSTRSIIPNINIWNQAHTRSKMYLPNWEKLLLVKEFPLGDDGLPDAEALVKFFDKAETDFGKVCKNNLSVY